MVKKYQLIDKDFKKRGLKNIENYYKFLHVILLHKKYLLYGTFLAPRLLVFYRIWLQ